MAPNYPLHQLLVIEGETADGDIWSTSLKTMFGPSPGIQMSLEQQNDALETVQFGAHVGLASVVADWWSPTAGRALFASAHTLSSVKYNSIGHDGRYVFPDTSEHLVTPPIAGGNDTTPPDPRESVTVTLRAAYERGRGSYGRMYPPNQPRARADIGSSYMPTDAADDVLAQAVTLIQTINQGTMDGNAITVVNVSPGDTVSGRQSVITPVTRVQVDRVVDTQRRRTNRIPRLTVTSAI